MIESLAAFSKHDMTKGSTHAQRGKSALVRFEEKIHKTDGCWFWTSAKNPTGYGVFRVSKERPSEGAHRYALELKLGYRFSSDQEVMHACDNPSCVNPDHLSLGSASDNQQDSKRKGRNAAGEKNGGGRKLTAEDAKVIFFSRFISSGNQAAKRFGVSRHIANAIRRGEIWRSATGG